jgi:hypothetical protein
VSQANPHESDKCAVGGPCRIKMRSIVGSAGTTIPVRSRRRCAPPRYVSSLRCGPLRGVVRQSSLTQNRPLAESTEDPHGAGRRG